MYVLAPRAGAVRPRVPGGGTRCRGRPRVGRRGGDLVARTARVRDRRGARRRGDRRRCNHPRCLLADCCHRRADDARRDLRPCTDALGPPRVGGTRGRARGGVQVPGCGRARSARGCGVGEVALARARGSRGRGRVRARDAVRPDPCGPGLGRDVTREQPRAGRLARLRARSSDSVRLRRPALGRARPGAGSRSRGARGRAVASPPSRPRARVVRGRLLVDADAAAGALRPLRPAVDPGSRGARRERAFRRAPGADAARRAARLVDRRCAHADPDGHASDCCAHSCTQALPASASVAADPSTPPLGRRVLDLQLPGPGRPTDPNRSLARLRSRGVRLRARHGAVTDRVLARPLALSAREPPSTTRSPGSRRWSTSSPDRLARARGCASTGSAEPQTL